jgi:hypothetical protein
MGGLTGGVTPGLVVLQTINQLMYSRRGHCLVWAHPEKAGGLDYRMMHWSLEVDLFVSALLSSPG